MERIKVVPNLRDSETKCHRCDSFDLTKAGKRNGKQIYRCKKCNFRFTPRQNSSPVHSRHIISQNVSAQEMKLLDVWDLRILGKKPSTKEAYSVNFYGIEEDWLKQTIKDYVWFRANSLSTSRTIHYTNTLRKISTFTKSNYRHLKPKDISRDFAVDLINYVFASGIKAKTISDHIGIFQKFFDYCQNNHVIPQDNGRLIYDSDYPRYKRTEIKDIPDYVLKQLQDNLLALPSTIKLIVETLLETGMRIDEVCSLEFNCIEADSDGDYWLNCSRSKVYKEDRLFISKELAIGIQEQQKLIREKFGNSFDYLFCSTEGRSWFDKYGVKSNDSIRKEINHFIPVAKKIQQDTVRGYLKQLASEHNIKDISGEIYPIWKCHRFRHTHLTDLARKGTGIAHIMQRAGHASPAMTMRYIHLTNDDQKKKMKEVWDNAHFNMEGEIVAPVNPDLDTAEMQWIKKGMGMQTTDNGYCTLLWTQTCPHQDLPCKSCGSWVTTLDFLDSHKKELEETDRIIENARQKGYQKQIEKNVPRAERLKKIISAMEKHVSMRGLGHNEWEEKQ